MTEENVPAPPDGRADNSKTGKRQLASRVELRHLMRSWRLRLDPKSIPGLSVRGGRGRPVSQAEMAQLVGVSSLWYGRLERGEREPNYSEDFLDRVAAALRLDYNEHNVLFLLATGREPVPKVYASTPSISPAVQRVLDEMPFPAWCSDPAWDVVALNQATYEWLPHMRYERNVMRWVWCYPDAMVQLVDWQSVWSPRMLAQMRVANARWPQNERLKQIIAEALEVNDYAREAWDNEPMVQVHPDGDVRRLRVPFLEDPVEVELVALAPMRDPDLRLIMLVPRGQLVPTIDQPR